MVYIDKEWYDDTDHGPDTDTKDNDNGILGANIYTDGWDNNHNCVIVS